jgi:uncharacterized protein (DUF58 family)
MTPALSANSLPETRPLRAPHTMVPRAASAKCGREGRLPFAFGARFYLVLFVGLIWLGPAWWDARFLYGMLAWDVLALFLWAWDLAKLPAPEKLEVRRKFTSAVALSVASRVAIELSNAGAETIHAEILDDTPTALTPEPRQVTISARGGNTASASYEIFPRSRGDARFGNIFLRYQSGLRLAERWARADVAQTVRVYANLDEARRHTIYLIRSRQVELEKRLKRQRGQGREFESLRDFRDGDELRDICWTATARRSFPVTKVFQVERSQAVWICMDAGRLMRARIGKLSKLDCAANAALSLTGVVLHGGDRAGLLAYGRQIQQRVKAARGAPQLRAMVESLALVHGEPNEADHLRAARVLLASQKQRCLIVWFTDLAESAATPEVVEAAMQLARRHLVLFVVVGQPDLTELARQTPQNVEEMYRVAAAVETVHRRDITLARLRRQGVLTVELAAEKLSTAVINHYLDIKERSLL